MKLPYLLPLLAVAAAHAEEKTDLATADAYRPQYDFSPPPVITPQTPFGQPLENQFDYQRPWTNPSVAQNVSTNTTRPLQIEASIGNLGDQERLLYRQRGSNLYGAVQAYRLHLDDYKDGSGQRVHAGYTRDGEMAMLGFVPDARQEYRIGVVRDHIADDKQPQHQMDAVKTQRIVVNANARLGAQDQSNTINLTARHIELDRTANNYKLRTTAPNSPRVKMEVERSKTDLNADYRIQYGEQRSHIGLQYGRDSHNAERFALTPQGARRNAYRFADIHSDHYHLYYDHYWNLTPEHQISGGLSYDRLTADVKKKNTPSKIGEQNFPAPNQLWQQYYGRALNGKRTTSGVGAALAYEFHPGERQKYRIGVDSRIRQPENPERFTSLPGQNGMGWIGNPYLKPERHNRIAISGSWQGEGWRDYGKVRNGDLAGAWQIEAAADYDKVHDFITYDRARGQNGIHKNDGNIISRNTNATLIGAEISAAKSLTGNLATRGKLRYQYGENNGDHRPLYNVRPLSADLALDWQDYASFGSYNLGANLHYAHKSTRLDSDKTKGLGFDNPLHYQSYATVNLYASLQTRDRFAVSLGIDNLLDRKYHAYNEQPHVASLSPAAVAAPERTYWLGFSFNF